MYNSIQFTVVVHYRDGKLHNIVYEAMIQVNHIAEVHHLEEALTSISTFHDGLSQTSFTALMGDASCSRMVLLFQESLGTIGNDNPLTAKVLDYYIDVVEIMLGLHRERDIGCSISHQSAS